MNVWPPLETPGEPLLPQSVALNACLQKGVLLVRLPQSVALNVGLEKKIALVLVSLEPTTHTYTYIYMQDGVYYI